MRCNSNCSCNCNRNCGRNCGRNCNNDCTPFSGMGYCMNQPSVFAAGDFTPSTLTAAATTPIAITNILYNYGCAIQASIGSSIYITQPGLYQVSYAINATNTAVPATNQNFSAYLTRNTIQFAQSNASVAANATGTLANTELIYVSPYELPLTLSLNLTNSATSASYAFFITINRICSCESECGYVPSFPPAFIDSNFTSSVTSGTVAPNPNYGPVPFGPMPLGPVPFGPVPFGPISPCNEFIGESCSDESKCCDGCSNRC